MRKVAVAILAAGQSRRFGNEDKLLARFRGKPLGQHVSDRLAALAEHFAHRWVVASSTQHPCVAQWERTDWTVLANDKAEEGMGTSLALAANHAMRANAEALLVCLADMPLVPVSHFLALRERIERMPDEGILVTSDGNTRMPPAAFGAAHFAHLASANQDVGARALLARGERVECDAAMLTDIDDAETLQRLN